MWKRLATLLAIVLLASGTGALNLGCEDQTPPPQQREQPERWSPEQDREQDRQQDSPPYQPDRQTPEQDREQDRQQDSPPYQPEQQDTDSEKGQQNDTAW